MQMYSVLFEREGEVFATFTTHAWDEADALVRCDAFFRAHPAEDPRERESGLTLRVEEAALPDRDALLLDRLNAVADAASFLTFVRCLMADRVAAVAREHAEPSSPYGPDAGGWENTSIDGFLEAALAWAEDSDFGARFGLPDNPWRRVAAFLMAGKYYE